jgi:hypothetical protein
MNFIVDALIIAEPSETNIVYAHKGSMDYKITSKGKAAHSSVPVVGLFNCIKSYDRYRAVCGFSFRSDFIIH